MGEWEKATQSIRDVIDKQLADERKAAMQDAISAYDPMTLAGGGILLVLVALLACQLPIRKAARTDPAIVLRCD
jgi:ABC-type lipoprotein release transport system permease subunit